MDNSRELTTLWNDWIKTDEGKGYEAGWGDHYSQILAMRGRVWCRDRVIERRDAALAAVTADVARVTAEKDDEVIRLLAELAAAFAKLAELQDELAVALSDAARESDIFYDVVLGEI